MTTRSGTLLDLVCTARRESDGSRLLDRGRQQGWVRPDDIDRRLTACPSRHGNARLRRLRAQLDDGAAAHSERLLHGILRRGGLTVRFTWADLTEHPDYVLATIRDLGAQMDTG